MLFRSVKVGGHGRWDKLVALGCTITPLVPQPTVTEPQWEVALELLDMVDTLLGLVDNRQQRLHMDTTHLVIQERYNEIAATFDAQLAAAGELDDDWPTMPELEGVDLFKEYPVVGGGE